MKKIILLTCLLFSPSLVQAAQNVDANCDLAQKQLNLIKSEKEVLLAQYKLAIKDNIRKQIQAGTANPNSPEGGKKITLKVDANSKPVQAISKLAIAEATFEATLEMCKEGSLKSPTTSNVDGYKAQLIPKPEPITPARP